MLLVVGLVRRIVRGIVDYEAAIFDTSPVLTPLNVAILYAVGEVACTGVHGANRLAPREGVAARIEARTLATAAGARL